MGWELLAIILGYWLYCAFAQREKTPIPTTAKEYFIADRQIPAMWFILAATATSFSGWTFVSHPGMIYGNGFQASFISFYAITIAFTGVLFLKRQWMLGKRYDFITPGDMFAAYFEPARRVRWDWIKIFVVLISILFSVLYVAVQLRASGYLINTLIEESLPISLRVWINEQSTTLMLAAILTSYVLPRGFKRVAFVDRVLFIFQTLGMILLGVLVLHYVGGFEALKEGMIELANYDSLRAPLTPEYSHYFSIPGVIQTDVFNFNKDTQNDGWTGMMLLTFMLALMGIQSSPAFTMWAFANESPKSFWIQQVIFSSLIVGFVMLVFTTIQGIGAHFLLNNSGFALAHPEAVNPLMAQPTSLDRLIPDIILLASKDRILHLVALFLAVAGLAAMQSTASSYILTAGATITRDFFNIRGEETPEEQQKQITRGKAMSFLVIVVAVLLALSFRGQQVALWGGLAVAFGLQMWPALVAICWWSFLTRAGIISGLITGIVVVIITENPFSVFDILVGEGNWMRWPLTIHSAGWGLFANFLVAFIVSGFTQHEKEIKIRLKYHNFLKEHDTLPENKSVLKPFAWLFVLTWFFLAVGPGAVIGNDFFGNPNDPNSWWFFGFVPIWAWQAVFWALGVFMMWFIAYYMEMGTMSEERIAKIRPINEVAMEE